mgnify:CR=1 FL=1
MALQSQTAEDYQKRSQESNELKPYYIENVTITGAKDVSGVDGEYHFERDTAILLSLDIGKDFEPDLFIGGDFKIDWDNFDGAGDAPRVKPLEWGSNFKVDELAARAGLSPLFDQEQEDNVIRDGVLEGLIGESIVYLRYCYGEKSGSDDLGYTQYDFVRFPKNFVDDAVAALKEEGNENPDRPVVRDKAMDLAKADLERSFDLDAYVDDYAPEAVEAAKSGGSAESDDFGNAAGDGAPSPNGSGWSAEENDTFEPDDDLPF